jgi:hypothetical protein
MAFVFQRAERATNGAFPLPAAMCNPCQRRPALHPFVIGLVSKRQQHQLFTGR